MSKKKKLFLKSRTKVNFHDQKKYQKKLNNLNKSQIKIQNKIEAILSSLPNLALDEVPVGKDDSFNKEIKKIGEISKFEFKPISHYEIGKNLNLMDFDAATKTSGARFVFLKGVNWLCLKEQFLILCLIVTLRNSSIKKYHLH